MIDKNKNKLLKNIIILRHYIILCNIFFMCNDCSSLNITHSYGLFLWASAV